LIVLTLHCVRRITHLSLLLTIDRHVTRVVKDFGRLGEKRLGNERERLPPTIPSAASGSAGTTTAPMKAANYQLAETICVPRPIRQPRPPTLSGPNRECKTGGSTLPTPKPATSPSGRARPSTSRACPPATATPKLVTSRQAKRRSLPAGTHSPTSTGSCRTCSTTPGPGIQQVWLTAHLTRRFRPSRSQDRRRRSSASRRTRHPPSQSRDEASATSQSPSLSDRPSPDQEPLRKIQRAPRHSRSTLDRWPRLSRC
jgi:hypothetical protein